MDYDILLDLTAELGYQLASSGAETFRVEESVSRILSAYSVTSEVFAIPTCLIVSIETTDGKLMTRMRRITNISNNMDAVESYNNLSRTLCATTPDLEEAVKMLKSTKASIRNYGTLAHCIGGFLAGCGFSVFFGGDWVDFLCGGLCGVLVAYSGVIMKRLRVNQFFSTTASAFLLSLLAYLLHYFNITHHVDSVIIGTLMLLVPGLLFTNGMRDILFGDTNSGVNRVAQVLLIAVAIALGTGVGSSLLGALPNFPAIPAPATRIPWLQCVASFVGCAGFVYAFNAHGKGAPLCMLGGALAWAAYCVSVHFGAGEILGYFIAAVISAFYSEAMARFRKCPAIAYLVVSMIPLFPGADIYYATSNFVQGNMDKFVQHGILAIEIGGAIAIGILSVSTLVRLLTEWKQRNRIKKTLG